MFQVGEVSRHLDLNPQTIYFYERIGLIPPPRRTESGYRLFSQKDMERLAFIIRAKSLGFSLEEIKEILELKSGNSLTCEAVYNRLNRKIRDIDENIRKLQAMRNELIPLVRQSFESLDISNQECTVLDHATSESKLKENLDR